MNISRPIKNLLAAATVWPFVYFVLFFLFAASGAIEHAPAVFPVLILVHMLTGLSMLGAWVFCLVDISMKKNVTTEWRVLWILLIVCLALFTMPIYVFKYVLPER